jgi:hypothetical protein
MFRDIESIADGICDGGRGNYENRLLKLLHSERGTKLTDAEVWYLIAEIWEDNEFPSLRMKEWKEIFKVRPAPASLTSHLPNEFEAYRGGTLEGLSWTTSKETAEWFWGRHQLFGNVEQERDGLWRAKIKRHQVLFTYDERGEKEIVLRPESVLMAVDEQDA